MLIKKWIILLKQYFKPKVGSAKWYRTATTEAIKEYREVLWKKLMDPNENDSLRAEIRDYAIPHIDKILNNRDKK